MDAVFLNDVAVGFAIGFGVSGSLILWAVLKDKFDK